MTMFHAEARRLLRCVLAALCWWIEGLWLGLPARLRGLFEQRDRLVVQIGDDGIVARRATPDAGTAEPVQVPFDQAEARELLSNAIRPRPDADVILMLPPYSCLQRTFTLPLAAEPDLHRVLYFELDRLTPFPLDEIAFAHDRPACDSAKGTLRVRVVVTRRSAIEEATSRVEVLGLSPTVATLADLDGNPLPINLLPGAAPIRLPFTGLSFRPALAGAAAAALLLALYLPLSRYDALLSGHARVTEQIRAEALEARATTEAAAAELEPLRYFDARRSEYVRPLDVLLELTTLIPEHTWLSRMSIARGQLQLQGETPASSTVLELVESAERLRGAAFQTPVSRASSGHEQFTITASVRGARP